MAFPIHQLNYFHALAGTAVLLLWGISLLNGTVWTLLKTAYFQTLPDGAPFQAKYTGLIIVDFPLALLVGFFFYGTNDTDHAYQVFLVNAYATLQPAYVWLYVEAARLGEPLSFVQSPVFFGLLWQMFGAAISLPLFFAMHLTWDIDLKALPRTSCNQIRSLPIGFLLGAVLPVVTAMYPTWSGPDARSSKVHQYILAWFQLDPVWVSLLQTGIACLMGRVLLPRYSDAETSSRCARTAYGIAAAVSAASHYHMIWQTLSYGLSWTRMFFPSGLHGPSDVSKEEILLRGPWLFLQWDFIIIALSSLSWAFILIRRVGVGIGTAQLIAIMAVACLVCSPGAVVSLALYYREHMIGSWASERRLHKVYARPGIS